MFKYKFQHYVDIATSAESLTMIKIQAGGVYAMQRMKHLWGAFKYVKMGRVSVKLLPASTLPVDPLGLSYADTDPQTVDPRDQMNPGLVRITNGEDILDDFSSLDDTAQEQIYINTMLDPRWSKFMLQRGFSRSAVPLYWNVGQLQQDVYPGHVINIPRVGNGVSISNTDSIQIEDYFNTSVDAPDTSVNAYYNRLDSDGRGLFQVGHKGRLGWMPTDAFEYFHLKDGSNIRQPLAQPLPAINVISVLLPKAFKTIYYYRMFITETFMFSGIKNEGIAVDVSSDGTLIQKNEYRAVDNFMYVPTPEPRNPSQPEAIWSASTGTWQFGYPMVKNDGDQND